MFNDNNIVAQQLTDILRSSKVRISDMKPSEWAEKNIVITMGGNPGPLRYKNAPYMREIVDCLAEDHPARVIAIQKGQQIGASATVIIPALAYIIANIPGPTVFSVGAPDLIKAAATKLDLAVKSARIDHLIRAQVQGKVNNKSGDTIALKEFLGGWIKIMTLNNHDNIRDFAAKYGFLDDLDANSGASKDFGDTGDLIKGRFTAYDGQSKIFKISTPKFKHDSQIEPAFLLGDQRKFHIPCPCCHDYIEILWTCDGGGIHWEPDGFGGIKDNSVGYVCPKCSQFFTDKHKMKWLNEGIWQPTAQMQRPGHYSYKISSLYAPTFMTGWTEYVRDWLIINPAGQARLEKKYQTFQNVVLGETYEITGLKPSAASIRENIRPYTPGIVPTALSEADGNGRIVLLTLGSDCNGVRDDARIDFEIVAHAESGATYSVLHGSVGTFIPRENSVVNKVDRKRYTYEMGKENSVWTEVYKIFTDRYIGEDGMCYQVNMPVVDIGHLEDFVWTFIDYTIGHNPDNPAVGVRGDREEKYKFAGANLKLFNVGKARSDSYWLQVGLIKDMVSTYMTLKSVKDEPQPANYMNFPTPDPEKGLYMYEGFFQHFESEQRKEVEDKDGGRMYRWVKNTSTSQNHLWDCRIYAIGAKEIIVYTLGKLLTKGQEEKSFTWSDYVAYVTS